MKNIITNLLLIISFVTMTQQTSAQVNARGSENYNVVFQLSTNDTMEQKAFLKQLDNLTEALHNVNIEVVVLGPGITFIEKSSPFSKKIEELHSDKLKFLVCRNTMQRKKIEQEDLNAVAEIIPAGLAHIIKRQAENWSYIKVGF